MEINPQHSDYNKSTENKPNEWSYQKLGLSTDHERLLEKMHVDYVENTGKMNKDLIEKFSSNHFKNKKYIHRFYLYSLFAIIVGILCYLMNSEEKKINIMNFFKSPVCIGITVSIMLLYYGTLG